MNNSTPQQTLPFDNPLPVIRKSRKHKQHRVSEASKLTFEDVKLRRNKAFLMILVLLTEFDFNDSQRLLTAREMLRVLQSRELVGSKAERNHISPRLSALLDLGCVENPTVINEDEEETFLKRVDGYAAASVWRITDKGRELLACLHRLHEEVKG
jgi:hypothetical protein